MDEITIEEIAGRWFEAASARVDAPIRPEMSMVEKFRIIHELICEELMWKRILNACLHKRRKQSYAAIILLERLKR